MINKLFRWQVLALAVWLISLVSGLKLLWGYETTPGVQTKKTARIFNTSILQLAIGKPTLIMFAHPQCPCTKASMIELQDIARQLRSSVQIKVFFIQPASKDRGWVESSSWALAKMIPEAEIITDPYGSVARMFNAQVSGEAVLYSADGELLFSGGITPSRGHIGENRGAKSIIEAVRLGKTTTQRTPTYGCALFNNMERGTIAWK